MKIEKGLKNPQRFIEYPFEVVASKYYMHKDYDIIRSSDLKELTREVYYLPDSTKSLDKTTAQMLAPRFPDRSYQVITSPNFRFSQPFVVAIDNVSVNGPFAVARCNNGRILADVLTRRDERNNIPIILTRNKIRHLLQGKMNSGRDCDHGRIKVACIIHRHSRSGNFYHWMIDHMTKLRYVEEFQKRSGREATLIISDHLPAFGHEALKLLGFNEQNILWWDGGKVKADTLVVPSWPEPTPGNLNWLRSRMQERTDSNSSSEGWIYISRQKTKRGRRISNFIEIEEVLLEHGVRIVDLETMCLKREIELVSAADGIIGPHGAGLTTMVWAEDLHVVELFNGIVKMPFYVIAHILGHEYSALMGEPVTLDSIDRARDLDFKVDPKELDELLNKVIGG